MIVTLNNTQILDAVEEIQSHVASLERELNEAYAMGRSELVAALNEIEILIEFISEGIGLRDSEAAREEKIEWPAKHLNRLAIDEFNRRLAAMNGISEKRNRLHTKHAIRRLYLEHDEKRVPSIKVMTHILADSTTYRHGWYRTEDGFNEMGKTFHFAERLKEWGTI